MEQRYCNLSSLVKYAIYTINRKSIMARHTTKFVIFLFFLLGRSPLFAQSIQNAESLAEAPKYQKISQESLNKEIIVENLIRGQKYALQFLIENAESCLPIAKMDIPYEVGRETSEQFILDFVATKATEKISLKTPCVDNPVNSYYGAIQCTTCPNNAAVARGPVIQATSGQSADYLIKDVFVAGGCYDVDNIEFVGPDIARGVFSQGDVVGLTDGIILATGDVSKCSGPNTMTSTTTEFSGNDGDDDLNTLLRIIGSQLRTTRDVSVIEFDFTPTSDKVSFEYVWASEEYCDYSNSSYNDVFGFFVSGPGIDGPFSNDGINIATIPGTNDYVSINNINWKNNRPLYNNNTPGLQALTGGCAFGEIFAAAVAKSELEYDGFTNVFTATVDVIPCETYHIKLALGDVGDKKFDSAVFLGANSFKLGDPAELSTEIPNASFPDSNLVYESCQESFFVFKRTEDSDRTKRQIVPFNISPTSTATANVDYSAIPSPVIIPVGQDSIKVPVTVFDDGIAEGPESIVFELESACTCEGIMTELIIVEPEEPIVNFDELATCPGGSVDISPQIEGGVGDFTYEWSTDETTSTISAQIDEPTTYFVTVTDECGISSMGQIEVTIDEQVAKMSGDVLICNDEATSQIEVNFTGSGPYSLEYEFNGETRNISNINEANFQLPEVEAGIYEAIAMTSSGCVGTGEGTAEIVTTEVNIEYKASNPKCHKSTDGFIELTMDTDNGTYQYLWGNGANENKLENLEEGDFEVTVTNELGCESVEMFTITKPDKLEATIIPNGLANCYNPNAGSIDLEVEGGTPGYAYAWSNGVGTMQNPTDLEGGTYSVVVTDLNGCEATLTTEIMADLEEPLADIQVDDIISCRNDKLTLTAIGTSRGFNFKYQWNTEDGRIERFESRLEPVVTQEGTYTLEVLNETNGCTTTATAFVKEDTEQPAIELNDPMELNCQIETQNLVGVIMEEMVDYTLEWSSDNGNFLTDTDILEPEIDVAGEYTLLVTNNINGCMIEKSVVVTQNIVEPQFLIVDPKTLTCDRKAVSIKTELTTPEKDYQIVWETIEGNFLENRNTLNPSVDEPGIYNLKITDTENFCEADAQVNILIDTLTPKIEAGATAVFTCDISQMDLNGTVADNRDYDFEWTTEDGVILSGENSLTPSINEAGTYQIFVKDEVNGCEAIDMVVITDDTNRPQVVIETSPSITCENQTVQLDASNSTQGGSINYRWETFDGDIVDATNPINPIMGSAGTYLLFVVDQTNGCEGKGTVKVGIDTISPIAIVAAADVFNCKSEKVEIDGSASSTGSNFQYNWSTVDGDIISNTNVVSPAVSSAGTYTLEIINMDNGCTAETSLIIIDEKPTEVDMALNQPLCFGDKGQANVMQVVGGVGPYTYSIDGGNRFNTEAGFSYLNPGSYNVVVKDANDCELEEIIEIIEPDEVFVDLGLQQEIGLGDSTNLEAITNIPAGQVAEIMWSPATGLSCDDCLNPMAKPFQSVDYEVTVIDQNGCEANSSVRLIVDQTPHIFVPNIFNPTDSQAGNDRFTIFSKQGMVNQIITLEVYNRWGETVFQRKNFSPNDPSLGWDGSFNRKPLRPAVFVYRAELEMIDGRKVQIKGDFTLMN